MSDMAGFLPKGFNAKSVSLEVMDGISWDDFAKGASAITRLQNFSKENLPYMIGDLINAGERLFKDRFEQAMEFTDYSIGTLKNYAYLCKRVPPENRNILSVLHTFSVAPLEPEKQREALMRAKKEGLDSKELRRLAKGNPYYKTKALPVDGSTKRQRLYASFDRTWELNKNEWMNSNPKEAAEKVWKLAVDMTLDRK
jgi:hypothetical protein